MEENVDYRILSEGDYDELNCSIFDQPDNFAPCNQVHPSGFRACVASFDDPHGEGWYLDCCPHFERELDYDEDTPWLMCRFAWIFCSIGVCEKALMLMPAEKCVSCGKYEPIYIMCEKCEDAMEEGEEYDFCFALMHKGQVLDIIHLDEDDPEYAMELFMDEFGWKDKLPKEQLDEVHVILE